MSVGERILLIDDDEAVRRRLLDLLEPAQTSDTRETLDGRVGLAAVLATPPDLVRLDLIAPGMTGFAVWATLRADVSSRAVPVIVLSSADELDPMPTPRRSAETLEGALSAGCRSLEVMVSSRTTAGAAGCWPPREEGIAAVVQNIRLSGRVTYAAVAGAGAQPEMSEVVLGELGENYATFSDALNAGVTANPSSAGEQGELRVFAPGPGSPPDVFAKLGQPYRQWERNFSGDLPGIGLDLAAARTRRRARGDALQCSSSQGESGLVGTVVLPPHLVRSA